MSKSSNREGKGQLGNVSSDRHTSESEQHISARTKEKRYLSASHFGPSHQSEQAFGDIVERFRGLLTVIRNRWLAGLLAAVCSFAIFWYVTSKDKPEYTAVTTLLAQSTLDEILLANSTARSVHKNGQENLLQNHLSVMQSRRFSVALAREFTDEERAVIVAPYMDPEYDPTTASMAFFEQRIVKRMGATRERDREFFTLSFRHRDPDTAVMVANRMATTYLKLVQEEIKEANLVAADILENQARELQEQISELEEAQRNFRERHSIVSVEEDQGLLADRLRRIDENRYEARVERIRLESLVIEAKRDLASEGLPFHNPFLANYSNIQELKKELDALSSQRSVMALRYGKKHPKMLDIESNINELNESLKNNLNLAYRDLENQYETQLKLEQRLETEFKEEFGKGIENARLANEIQIIGNEVTAKKETLNELLRRLSNAVVESHFPADVMRVVDPAFLAQPRFSKKKIDFAFGFLLTAGAFFGVPLFWHLFDLRLKCATDIEKELGKELIGGIPGLSKIRSMDRPHVVRDYVDYSKVEPFMAIVAQLELVSCQRGPKSFVITSTASGEGKSTISSNLAAGFTQIGRKTIIVDCDLRRPCQHQFNRTNHNGGLIPWAEAGYPTEDLFQKDSPLGIRKISNGSYLLQAGGVRQHPTRLLISTNFEYLFQQLKEQFDTIIMDTPPVGLYPDALVVSRLVGETILIARESKAPVSQIRRVIADIDNTLAPVLGVVLNDYSAGSLNPRLAHNSYYNGYGYSKNSLEFTRVAPSVKSMVARVMAERSSEVGNGGAKPRRVEPEQKTNLNGKGKPKSLIGKLMENEKL